MEIRSMRRFRLGVVGAILAALIAGCDGGSDVETTMPTTPTTMPPEMEQMKNDMNKRFHANSAGTKPTSSARRK
jgi:hypothetical protein